MLKHLLYSRPFLVLRGLAADRNRPDLASLAAELDPESFVWRVLPHAARSFSASIVVLRKPKAIAAAVAYLYCRILDTYEDLYPDPTKRRGVLTEFAARFDGGAIAPPPPIGDDLVRDDRDRLHLLLIERIDMIDAVYASLPASTRRSISELVSSMAAGMCWSTDLFASQGGVLENHSQVARYCHNVIGYPALFMLQLVTGEQPTPNERRDALAVSEMIQLANVTRDIEKDLARGVAYHPALRPYLAEASPSHATIRLVRRELSGRAMGKAPAYGRLFDVKAHRPSARLAGILMLLFTELHYRRMARMTGQRPWKGPTTALGAVVRSLPALVSAASAQRILGRVETDFLRAAAALSRH